MSVLPFRIGLVVCMFLLGTASARAQTVPEATPRSYRLRNGLQVTLAPDETASQACVLVRYEVGSRDDPPGFRGLAHLTEHMTFRAGDTLTQLDNIGATESNGVTGSDDTWYYALAAPEALSSLLWLEARRMAFAASEMSEAALERERKIVVHEWREHHDGGWEWQESLWARVYPEGHPYRLPFDRVRDVESASLENVQWFTQSHYRPENAHLVVLGSFDPEQAKAAIELFFGKIRGTGPAAARAVPEAGRLEKAEVVRHFARVAHESLTVIWPCPAAASRDFAALEVLAEVISERLSRQLVPGMGPASRTTVSLEGREYDSWFIVESTARDENKAEAMLTELDAALQTVGGRGVQASLLERAKQTLNQARTRRTLAERALALARRPARKARLSAANEYDAVDMAALKRAAARWLPVETRLVGIVERDWE